jgi:hypothetical protein
LLYISLVNAGAPAPKDINSLPRAPHAFNNTTNLSIGVEWEEAFINRLIYKSNSFRFTNPIKGGISVFKSKNHKDFSNLSGSYIWVDVINLNSNNLARLVISGVYGSDDLISDVMKLVYNLNVYNGSNKFILINNKASVRSSIRKKNVLNMVLEKSNECIASSGNYKFFSIKANNTLAKSIVDWNSIKLCKANPKSITFSGVLKDYKISKLLWAETSEDYNFTINNLNR